MEKQPDYTLMKVRSYRSVITTGLRYYTEHFRQLFKATWLRALIYAIVVAVAGTLLSLYGLSIFAVVLFLLAPITELFIWAVCKPFKPMAKAALKHWLLTIGILLAGTLLLLPFCLLTSLPLIILTLADLTSQVGQLIGDPQGMPSSLPLLTFGAWLLSSLLQVFLRLPLLFVGYFAYGSSEAKKQEKKQFNNQ